MKNKKKKKFLEKKKLNGRQNVDVRELFSHHERKESKKKTKKKLPIRIVTKIWN